MTQAMKRFCVGRVMGGEDTCELGVGALLPDDNLFILGQVRLTAWQKTVRVVGEPQKIRISPVPRNKSREASASYQHASGES